MDRVFRVKVHTLTVVVVDENDFGEVISYIGVIEFQNKGRSRAHCFSFLPESRVSVLQRTAICKVAGAEISSHDDSELREVIFKHNIHQLCR